MTYQQKYQCIIFVTPLLEANLSPKFTGNLTVFVQAAHVRTEVGSTLVSHKSGLKVRFKPEAFPVHAAVKRLAQVPGDRKKIIRHDLT